MVWVTWIGLPVIALLIWDLQGWPAGIFVLLVGILAQWAYIRFFPRVSRLLGYGSVADTRADPSGTLSGFPEVRLYTASVCPFCPIVRKRLEELRPGMGFELKEIDVTFQTRILRQKGLRSVPVIECGDQQLVGNATSLEISEFLFHASHPGKLPGAVPDTSN